MCTYTATPSKRMMMMGERGSFWVLLFSGIEPVSARKWRLVLFFCPALSGSQVLRVAVRSEGWLDVLLACSGLAWEVVPLIEVTCATGRGPPISRLHILLPSTPIYSNLVSSHLPTFPDPRWNFASTSGWRHIIRSPCRQQCLLAPEDPMNPRNGERYDLITHRYMYPPSSPGPPRDTYRVARRRTRRYSEDQRQRPFAGFKGVRRIYGQRTNNVRGCPTACEQVRSIGLSGYKSMMFTSQRRILAIPHHSASQTRTMQGKRG
jgi:hypothetical protein